METEYELLFDKSGKRRATICTHTPLSNINISFIGIAFCSDDDKWNAKTGERLAYARAIRALKNRKACVVRTDRIVSYIHNLKTTSLSYLMILTNYQTKYFPKEI